MKYVFPKTQHDFCCDICPQRLSCYTLISQHYFSSKFVIKYPSNFPCHLQLHQAHPAVYILQDQEIQQYRSLKPAVRGRGPNDIEMAALERKKQEEEAWGLVQIIKNREALKAQLQAENDPEYFSPGNKSSHKPPKGKTGPEGIAVDEDD